MHNDANVQEKAPNQKIVFFHTEECQKLISERDQSNEVLWNLSFDGFVSKEGEGVGIWVSNSYTHH